VTKLYGENAQIDI